MELYKNKAGQVVDADLQVYAGVYDFTIRKNEPVWFSKLVKFFDGKLTQVEISKAQDRLYDCGVLDMKYKKVGKLWTNCWFLEDEVKWFIKDLIKWDN